MLNTNKVNIKVICDGEYVYEGPLVDFLTINEDDEYLVSLLVDKTSGDVVETHEVSGHWIIEFI